MLFVIKFRTIETYLCFLCIRKNTRPNQIIIEMGADSAILYKPIKDLNASDEFREMCELNNFKNLNDILELHLNEMLLKPQFGMRMLKEFYSFLKAEGLEKLLKEK